MKYFYIEKSFFLSPGAGRHECCVPDSGTQHEPTHQGLPRHGPSGLHGCHPPGHPHHNPAQAAQGI